MKQIEMKDPKKTPSRVTYRLSEVAEMTGVPVTTIRHRIRSKKLRAVTGFGTWLVEKSELERFLRENSIGGDESA